MTTNEAQPVFLLSPPEDPILPTPSISTSTFKSISRKISSFSLRSSPPSPRPGNDQQLNNNNNSSLLLLPPNEDSHLKLTVCGANTPNSMYSPPSPTCSTPTSERAQPFVILQDKYKNHKKGKNDLEVEPRPNYVFWNHRQGLIENH